MEEALNDEVSTSAPKRKPAGVWIQVWLVIAVVVTGVGNTIAKQVASRPLEQYTYMLNIAGSFAQVPVYSSVLIFLLLTGQVPRQQLQFLWRRHPGHRLPFVSYLALAGFGDTLGDGVGMICTPYVQGPVHSLLTNCTAIFAMLLSMCVLGERYSLLQSVGLGGVFIAVVLGVLPSFEGTDSHSTNPWFATVLGCSCIGNASSFVIKEWLFRQYDARATEMGFSSREPLHAFVVNTHAALFGLPLAFLALPLNKALGQTDEDSFSYLREGMACIFTSKPGSCGERSVHEEFATLCVAVFVACNLAWYIFIILSVQTSGALATFVALKAVFPVSTILFALVNWPLLGITYLHWLVWASVCFMVPSIVVYKWASQLQSERARKDRALASCCWPLGAPQQECERMEGALASTLPIGAQ